MIPTLHTERLRLTGFHKGHFEDYAAMCADPKVMQHLGGPPLDRELAWRQMAMLIGHWSLRGFGVWALEQVRDSRFVGRVGLHQPEAWPGVEVTWALASSAWRQGYATEAAAAAIAFARDELGADALISLIQPSNERSIAVATRLGAQPGDTVDMRGVAHVVYRHK
jgi:RimJ/RimL family protein N-acetyltransferase